MGEFIVGLDLGQSADFSALSVIEKFIKKTLSPRGDKVKRETICHLRHLQRFQLGLPYPTIVESVIRLISREEFGHKPTLAIDATGIGGAVYDMFALEKKERKSSYELVGIKITGGEGQYRSYSGGYIVPKCELLKPFFKDYGSERFLIADRVSDREEFIKQVQSFDYDISDSGHTSFGARAGAHDDYIIAVALAMFVATLEPFTFQYFGGSGANEKKRPSLLDLERELKKSS